MLVREALPSDYAAISRLFQEVDAIHASAEPEVFQIPSPPGRSERFLEGKLDTLDAGVFVAEVEAPGGSDSRAAGVSSSGAPGDGPRGDAWRSVVGFAIVRLSAAPDIPVLRSRRFAYLEDIVVSSRCLRSGVGQALLRRAEEWTRAQDVRRLELVVWEFNRRAIEFYSALGYRTDYRWMSRDVSVK